jgi:hypothetical protein
VIFNGASLRRSVQPHIFIPRSARLNHDFTLKNLDFPPQLFTVISNKSLF